MALELNDTRASGRDPPPSPRRFGRAEVMLLVATVVWGTSFALAKDSGEAINRAAGLDRHLLGPLVTLAIRFSLAAALLLLLLPGARRGWTWSIARDAAIAGGLLWAGIVLQHLCLDLTTETLAAFLTSCAVLFVPLILAVLFKQRPTLAAYVGIALALPGIWLMAGGERFRQFDLGVPIGLGSAALLAGHLIAVGYATPRVGTLRICVAQFAIVGVGCALLIPLAAAGVERFDTTVLHDNRFWTEIALLTVGPTLLAFWLMAVYQPRVSPVRAVMIYLFEPIAAAAFAWVWNDRPITLSMAAGGVLILIANAVVEVLPTMKRHVRT